MQVCKRDGRLEEVRLEKITRRIQALSRNLKNVEPMIIAQRVISGLYDGVTTKELDQLAVKTAANLATTHPEYDSLAAKLSVSMIHKETNASFSDTMERLYGQIDELGEHRPYVSEEFIKIVRKHHKAINAELVYKRDYNFDYLGIETLKRSYLSRIDGKIIERPQHMWMRVAIGIHGKNIAAAFDTYDKMSRKLFTHATPTLFNAGTNRPQLSSCFLQEIDDDSIPGIYKTVHDCAQISQVAGGIGVHIHKIRSAGSRIYGTGGISNGLVPMLRVFDATANYVDQGGGRRKGSIAIYLEPWHADVFEWLDLKKNTGKDEVRARNLFYALWIPDLFMKRVKEDAQWTLMDPNVCKGLSDCHSEEFEKLYLEYEASELSGKRTIPARELWKKILETQIETSMPYMLYKDAANRKSNQQNLGTIKSSNLCAEIIEYTSPEEAAVCNLGSVALPSYVEGQVRIRFNHNKLHEAVKTLTKNLNKVIDINYYPIPETRNSNLKHRPIGLGVQGLADVFMKMRMNWDSEEAKKLNKEIFETIYHAAIEASVELAIEEGAYTTFEGSPASLGKLQFDLWLDELKYKSPEYTESVGDISAEEVFCSKRYDWKETKEKVQKHGLRNSLLIALMPTASTASILGNTESFEPIPSNIYKRNVLSGEFIRINKYLVKDLQKLDLWDDTMKQRIIAAEGSVQDIEEIPEEIRKLYRTVWELSQKPLIDLAADRGAFICQSQSFNLYLEDATFSKLTSAHFYAWQKGAKTGSYYVRQKAARQAQKFTVDAKIEKALAAAKSVDMDELRNDQAEYQRGIAVLKESGFSLADIEKMDRQAVIQTAKEACSLDDPDSCIMCSG